jgi:YegS/Rv2252/BmrU family lipid kinase
VKIAIIVNPIAGTGKRKILHRAVSAFNHRGVRPMIRETGKRGDAGYWAAEAADRGCDIVVAAGGDGTINEVANGLAGSRVALGVLPMGVANLLALEMGIPADPERAVDVIINGIPQPAYPGYVILRDEGSGKEVKRYFLLMTGIGFDGGVLHDIKRANVANWGKAAYVMTGIRAISRYTHTAFTVRVDRHDELTAYSAVVGKSRFYGGRFMVTPRASLKDQYLDVCLFTGPGALRMLKHAFYILTGRHLRQSGMYYAKARELEVWSRNEVHVQADGDFLGGLPARIGASDIALRIMVPGANGALSH